MAVAVIVLVLSYDIIQAGWRKLYKPFMSGWMMDRINSPPLSAESYPTDTVYNWLAEPQTDICTPVPINDIFEEHIKFKMEIANMIHASAAVRTQRDYEQLERACESTLNRARSYLAVALG